jgi:hypothetical protein
MPFHLNIQKKEKCIGEAIINNHLNAVLEPKQEQWEFVKGQIADLLQP